MSSASVSITLATAAVTLAVMVSVFRTVTDAQLQAMEKCAPGCNLGGPLISSPGEFVVPGIFLLLFLLTVTSYVAGWPIASAQMRR